MNNYKRSLMKEYNKIKKKYYNYIIIFQIGEFYEIFNKDAILCSKILNIILTKRNIGKLHTKNIYLSGFPCKSLYKYINILLKNNLKLVICNQKKKKKKIYRKITHIITPGTIIDYKLLINKNNNYICSIYFKKNNIGISLLDISTREFFVSENNIFFIKKIINNYNIKEILYKKKQKKKILQLFLNKNIILNKINN
ncbi:MAG: hypothetical protein ABUS76_00325 [Candidatus Shikimatogenerans sp. Ttur]|uniref:DNA mismatch repair protein MutS-like N-terminal domain-containing protein n=1 Tax=Candidatus Shikimatogenerans sp. Ttur TaxID=3158569 RepID=A0AAU7ZY51_9FLAO